MARSQGAITAIDGMLDPDLAKQIDQYFSDEDTILTDDPTP